MFITTAFIFGITAQRYILNEFVKNTSFYTKGPVCIDWSDTPPFYISQFKNCKEKWHFEYSQSSLRFDTIHKRIYGDLGKQSSFTFSGFDVMIVTQVFEHVRYPETAMLNIARMMKRDGFLIFTVPWIYPYHKVPNDFWRYSPALVKKILEENGFNMCKLVGDGKNTAQHMLSSTFPKSKKDPQGDWKFSSNFNSFSVYKGSCPFYDLPFVQHLN